MTISTTTQRVAVNGNGVATSFSFNPVTIFESSDLVVTKVAADGTETVLAEGSSATTYSVTVASYPGTGSITYPASGGTPLATGEQIVMQRVVPLTQTTHLENQGGYFPDVQETVFDRLVAADQQQQTQIDRSLRAPISDNAVATMPRAADRALQMLGFDASGNPIAATPSSALVSSAMQPVVASATTDAALEAAGVSAAMLTVIKALSTDAGLEAAGVSAAMLPVIKAATTGAGMTALGITSAMQTVLASVSTDAASKALLSNEYLDFRWFGAVGDGATDNLAAWNTMMAAAVAQTGGAKIVIPPGKYLFSAQATATLPAAVFDLQIEGAGAIFYWPNLVGGMALTLSSAANRLLLSGLKMTTGQAGGGTALNITQSAPLDSFRFSQFTSLVACGDNNTGSLGSNYWTVGAAVLNFSGAVWRGCSFIGANAGDGVHIVGNGAGAGAGYSILHTFTDCELEFLANGFTIGAYTQGIMINQCAIAGFATAGIVVPVGAAGTLEFIAISDCDIEGHGTPISISSNYPYLTISGSLVSTDSAGAACISLNDATGVVITGNFLSGNATGSGVNVGGSASGVTITGNTISFAGTGVIIGASTSNIQVTGNALASCTTPVTDNAPAGSGVTLSSNNGSLPATSTRTPSASPWSFTVGSTMVMASLAATTNVSSVTYNGGSNVLAGSTAANQPIALTVPPNTAVVVTYSGTLTYHETTLP